MLLVVVEMAYDIAPVVWVNDYGSRIDCLDNGCCESGRGRDVRFVGHFGGRGAGLGVNCHDGRRPGDPLPQLVEGASSHWVS
jgi:hypothetical protein